MTYTFLHAQLWPSQRYIPSILIIS